jgi:hypothetical protein
VPWRSRWTLGELFDRLGFESARVRFSGCD